MSLGRIKRMESEHLRFSTEISWPKCRVSFAPHFIGPNDTFPFRDFQKPARLWPRDGFGCFGPIKTILCEPSLFGSEELPCRCWAWASLWLFSRVPGPGGGGRAAGAGGAGCRERRYLTVEFPVRNGGCPFPRILSVRMTHFRSVIFRSGF